MGQHFDVENGVVHYSNDHHSLTQNFLHTNLNTLLESLLTVQEIVKLLPKDKVKVLNLKPLEDLQEAYSNLKLEFAKLDAQEDSEGTVIESLEELLSRLNSPEEFTE